MYLLGISRIRPARRNPCGDSLEGQLAEAWLGADDHPAAGVLVDPHSQHLTVEIRESARVRTVDHSFLEASDHTRQHASMPRKLLPGGLAYPAVCRQVTGMGWRGCSRARPARDEARRTGWSDHPRRGAFDDHWADPALAPRNVKSESEAASPVSHLGMVAPEFEAIRFRRAGRRIRCRARGWRSSWRAGSGRRARGNRARWYR